MRISPLLSIGPQKQMGVFCAMNDGDTAHDYLTIPFLHRVGQYHIRSAAPWSELRPWLVVRV